MAVIAFDEIHDGRDGAKERQGGKTVRTYTRVYRAKTDSNFDEAAEILTDSRCPILGTSYPYDTSCTCRSVRPRNEPFSKRVWIVTATYSNDREQPEQNEGDNPLADPARITWATETFQRVYDQDNEGKAILNTAGDLFIPQHEDVDARWVVTVRKNVAAVPTWILSYRNAVNSDTFTIQGISVAERCAKMSAIQIGEWQSRNDIWYLEFTFSLQLSDEPWDVELVSRGMRQRNPLDDTLDWCTNNGGRTRVTEPVLLDANGYQIADPTPDSAAFVTVRLFPEKPFSVLPLA